MGDIEKRKGRERAFYVHISYKRKPSFQGIGKGELAGNSSHTNRGRRGGADRDAMQGLSRGSGAAQPRQHRSSGPVWSDSRAGTCSGDPRPRLPFARVKLSAEPRFALPQSLPRYEARHSCSSWPIDRSILIRYRIPDYVELCRKYSTWYRSRNTNIPSTKGKRRKYIREVGKSHQEEVERKEEGSKVRG